MLREKYGFPPERSVPVFHVENYVDPATCPALQAELDRLRDFLAAAPPLPLRVSVAPRFR